MSDEPFPIRRVDVGRETTIWLPAGPGERDDVTPARAWSVGPAGVALGAVLASLALLRLGATAEGLLAAVVLGILGVLTVIDLEYRLLPNQIVGPAALAVLLLQGVLFPERLLECLAAAVCASLVLLIPGLLRRGAMGMGDVKLAGVLGAALGGQVLAALTLGSLASVPVALFLLLHGKGRTAALPFGPFLTLGTAVVLLV